MNFKIILDRFLTEELTQEELSFFLTAVREPANEAILLATLGDKLNSQAYQGLSIKAKMPEMWQAMLDKAALPDQSAQAGQTVLPDHMSLPDNIMNTPLPDQAAYDAIPQHAAGSTTHWPPISPVRRLFPFRQIAAAAILLLLAGATGYLIRANKGSHPTAEQTNPDSRFKNDIAPGGNKATLTLANGQTILLDSSSNGTLARQGNTRVVKPSSGQLAYQPAGEEQAATDSLSTTAALSYNTLSTPRGGQYQLMLPDGSKVWLNAASSIRYPTAFIGKERRVAITGEAYFEIVKNAAQPFKVKIIPSAAGSNVSPGNAGAGSEIEVLGTSFNIMAYEDDTVTSTTLLEGAVKVTTGADFRTLRPGQQLKTGNKGSIQIIPDADVQKTIAWKNGKFIFYNDDIVSIMKQLTRWYDIDVRMEQMVHDHYTGRISRQVNISQVLKMMEAAGGVSFSVQGKEVKID